MAEKQIEHLILKIEKNSIAARLGIQPGDSLISVNGESVEDVFDYRYRVMATALSLEIRKKDGTEVSYEVKKGEFDDLGIVFENS
ncbi:MAG: PDZ domain-containing protein, partial [Lachnospiraceae bacterium]|nr:PDZ domain-containing protein [Lachnospiraceae bacterium]